MTNRWVCARCFTSAEESATACPNCRLPRGMSPESVAGDVPASGEEAPTTESPSPASEVAAAPAVATVAPVAPASQLAQTPAWGAEERWVCRRCFSSNDGTATACAKCGQARDADPSADAAGGEAGWAPPQPVARQGGQFPWRLVIYGVIALVVVGGSVFAARRGDSGAITDAGTLSVFDLQVGDCFDADMGAEVTDVSAIPCAEPHVYEMYAVADYPAGEVPSAFDEDFTLWETDICVGRFEDYVGLDFNSSVFYIGTLVPSDESWADGDRALQCFLYNSTESPLTGSAQGSAR